MLTLRANDSIVVYNLTLNNLYMINYNEEVRPECVEVPNLGREARLEFFHITLEPSMALLK